MIDYLVVTAHPDDETAVAGLLLQAKAKGLTTGLICLTKGEAGGFAESQTRTEELKKAAELLELDFFRHLDFPDAGIEFSGEAVEKLVPLMREAAARVVLTIHPDDYHPDHLAVSRLVDRVVFVAGLKKHSDDDKTWHPNQVLYYSLDPRSNKNRPDIIFDVTDVYGKKLEVLRAHASQEIEPFIDELSRVYGRMGGFTHGEGLYIRQPLRLNDPKVFLNNNKIGK